MRHLIKLIKTYNIFLHQKNHLPLQQVKAGKPINHFLCFQWPQPLHIASKVLITKPISKERLVPPEALICERLPCFTWRIGAFLLSRLNL